ncbi:MAG: hypothetical protein ACQERK_05120, partial [Campylobacterota bacterium]
MIIIGHEDIPFAPHYRIQSISGAKKTKPGSTLHLASFDSKIAAYLHTNALPYSCAVDSLTQSVMANALGADYIIVDKERAKAVQKAAEHYLFDSKVLVVIDHT